MLRKTPSGAASQIGDGGSVATAPFPIDKTRASLCQLGYLSVRGGAPVSAEVRGVVQFRLDFGQVGEMPTGHRQHWQMGPVHPTRDAEGAEGL